MKNMFSIIVITLIAFVLVVSLSGCGSTKKASSTCEVEFKPIQVEKIQVETIETEAILFENSKTIQYW